MVAIVEKVCLAVGIMEKEKLGPENQTLKGCCHLTTSSITTFTSSTTTSSSSNYAGTRRNSRELSEINERCTIQMQTTDGMGKTRQRKKREG
jgi:hypothetical protein